MMVRHAGSQESVNGMITGHLQPLKKLVVVHGLEFSNVYLGTPPFNVTRSRKVEPQLLPGNVVREAP